MAGCHDALCLLMCLRHPAGTQESLIPRKYPICNADHLDSRLSALDIIVSYDLPFHCYVITVRDTCSDRALHHMNHESCA